MSSLPPRRSIQELGLEDRDEIGLYLELIRIIEKDIDEIKAGDTRSGWTSWAIMGGIVGALLMLFSETRKLKSFPSIEVETIWLAGVLFYNAAAMSLRVFYLNQTNIRPGRVRWPRDVYFPFIPVGLYALLIFLASIFLAFSLSLPRPVKIASLAALIFCSLLTMLMLGFSKSEFPLGNNRLTKKSGFLFCLVSLFLSLLGVVLLGRHLRSPLGEDATLPYVVAGLILVTALLTGKLISTMAPSRLLSSLQELRNDIVFLRVEIDEALKRYEVLSEGETLPDAVQKELSEILRDVSVIAYAHSNMDSLIKKMLGELPYPDDSQQTKEDKAKQMALARDSYLLHEARCGEILSSFEKKLKRLNKKLVRVSAATEDWAGANTIRSSLTQDLLLVERGEAQLKQRMQAVNYYLSNPEKIPRELRVPVSQTKAQPQFGNAKGLIVMSDDFDEPLGDFDEYTK